MHQLIILVGVVLCFVNVVRGQSLSGTVLDPQGGGVPNAQVKLYVRENGLQLNATSDPQGRYRFQRLAPGEYVVEAEAEGFARTAPQSIQLETGRTLNLEIPLKLAGVAQEIVVTAAGSAQPGEETSKAISTVGWQEIQARDEFSIAESLRMIAGLRYQQLGGPGSFTSLKTRGLRNEDTAILIDGQRLRDVAAPQGDGSGLLGDLIVTNVDRLEVLRGSGSSLYGTNAIGGVVNIFTDEGGGRTRGSLLTEGGSMGLFRGRAQVAGGFNEDRIAYSLGVAHLNVAHGVDGDDAARNTSGQGRIRFQLTPSASLSARIYATDSFSQTNESPIAVGVLPPTGVVQAIPLGLSELKRYESGVPVSELNLNGANFIPSANDPDFRREARFFSSIITFAQRPNEAFGYSVNYQALKTDRAFLDGPGGISFEPLGNTRGDYDGRLHTINARTDVRLGRSQLVNAGYEFESESYLNRSFQVSPADNSSVDVSQRSHTFFLQDQLRLLDGRLFLSAAFRTQLFSLNEPALEPLPFAPYQGSTFEAPPNAYTGDGSIAYSFRSSGTKLRAHVGNGYRAPSLYERFGTYFDSFFGYSTYGDPRLRPDRSIAFDAGIDQSLLNNHLRLSGTWFYTRLQEIVVFDFSGAISPETDPFGRFGGYRNTNGGLARGLEFSVEASPSRSLDLSGSYTYTNADQRLPLVPGIIRSFAIPDHQFSLVATQRLGQRIFINFDLIASNSYLAPMFDSNTFTSRAFEFDGLAKADLGASYRLPLSENRAIRFFGKVENLFDRDYYESGYRTPGATALGGVQFEF
ncbi:MAG TPA: carboxypeptidase regulatory-like domain-containing protein [Terriglobia bacterium]|nr:carboxypeptidase regulatory-like domain-containing protein [Terriglobia bacterium]